MYKTDILAFGAHPDDVECAAAGVIIGTIQRGGTVVIVDLTKGEMGSHGVGGQREKEAINSANILGVGMREQLDLGDGNIFSNKANRDKVVRVIRKYRPKIVLANAFVDRHPDHGEAAKLVKDACFLSGLRKFSTDSGGEWQEPWRPAGVYHYIQDYFVAPSFVVDISMHFTRKMKAIKAYRSQFVTASDRMPSGSIALLKQIEATNQIFGRAINVEYAEGFVSESYVGLSDLQALL
ncbi:MAG: bacillithiol biosynthesis deacetylase BshB1 [Sediminibacterium sp.]|nr:bacillithiol biosynthesis deacetylase BshB1 [Sediminibacterium sp.]